MQAAYLQPPPSPSAKLSGVPPYRGGLVMVAPSKPTDVHTHAIRQSGQDTRQFWGAPAQQPDAGGC